jgi:RepB DNA-primase from phage plasmid
MASQQMLHESKFKIGPLLRRRGRPRKFATDDPAARKRASRVAKQRKDEAEAAEKARRAQIIEHPAIAYLEGLFDIDDFIFFQLIHSSQIHTVKDTRTGKERTSKDVRLLPLVSVKEAITPEYISSLEAFQADGWNVYISMNPFPEGSTTRTERDIKNIRNLFLDADKTKGRGANALELIQSAVKAGYVPEPHCVLESSEGNYHITWAVDDFSWDEAKATLPVLASMLGGDMAAIDLHRVLRLPGFQNLKYPHKPVCNLISSRLGEDCYTKDQFNICISTAELKNVDSATSDELQKVIGYIEANAEEAKFELGSREEHNGGFKWVVECPWAFVHTTGTKDALIMLLGDGRPQFNCFHGHCNGTDGPHRGWSDIRKLWEERVGHFQRFGDEQRGQLVINGKVLGSIADTSNPVTSVTTSETLPEESADEIKEEELPAFPRLSGLLSELSNAVCPDIPYEFKIMAAVTHWGLIRSGLDTLDAESFLQPRYYTCFIKEPGYGKTAAMNEIRNFAKMWGVTYSTMSSVDSGPALVDEFVDVRSASILKTIETDSTGASVAIPARVLLDTDEMTDLFEKSKVTSQGRNSLFTEMLKLYEGNRTGNRSRKAGKAQVDNAHLAIIAGATPTGYERMWVGTGGGSTGLQSRFILISTANGKMPINKKPSNGEAISALLPRLQKAATALARTISLTAPAREMLSTWWGSSLRDKPSESRVEDMVKRLAIVLGATNDTNVIDVDLMTQAIQFGDYVIAARERFNSGDSYTWTQAMEDAIRKVGQRHRIRMTMNDYRRLVQPARKPGGIGPFIQAWKNLVTVGELKAEGTTVQGTIKYRL